MKAKVFLILIIIASNFQTLLAQDDELISTEEITVESSFEPSIPDVFKINLSPEIQQQSIDKPDFSYELEPVKIIPAITLKTIVPARIKSEAVEKLKGNYVKLGMGNYTTPYFEFFANNLRSKIFSFGAHIKHLSSTGEIKDYGYSGFSDNNVNLYGKKFTRTHTLNIKTFFDRKVVHYYGFQPMDFSLDNNDIETLKENTKQRFITSGVQLKLHSNYLSKYRLNHSAMIRYYYLFDIYSSEEHNILFEGNINKEVDWLKFSDYQKLAMDAEVDYYFNEQGLRNTNNGLVKVYPTYTFAIQQYRFSVGINTIVQIDFLTQMHFLPHAGVEVDVIKEHLKFYAGINGDMEKNSYKKLSERNPFVNPEIPLSFTKNKFAKYLGLKGNIANVFDYDVNFTNSTMENVPFFVTDTISTPEFGYNNQFTVVSDTSTYSKIMGDFGYQLKDKFKAMLHVQYNSYLNKIEEHPWHIPQLEASLSCDYNIQNKIFVRAEVFGFTDMQALVPVYATDGSELVDEYVTETIKGAIDLNLGIDYQYSKSLSAFLNFNNILAKDYFIWYQYPIQKFSVLGGISYSF